MRIVNFKKFVISVSIMIGIISMISILLTNISFSHEEIQYKEVYIKRGDTLWGISREEANSNKLYEGKDIRLIICDIKKLNNIDSNANLTIGQKIKIPYL